MGRVAKRTRAESPPLDVSAEATTVTTSAEAKVPRTEKRLPTAPTSPPPPPPRRVESKKFVPDVSDADETDAASARSDESVRVETSQEREEALVRAGDALTGDALKDFLQTNFVDYIDDKIFDVADLDLPGV